MVHYLRAGIEGSSPSAPAGGVGGVPGLALQVRTFSERAIGGLGHAASDHAFVMEWDSDGPHEGVDMGDGLWA
jgi:hypothetical protein